MKYSYWKRLNSIKIIIPVEDQNKIVIKYLLNLTIIIFFVILTWAEETKNLTEIIY